jgi:hypothetical protein
VTGRYVDLRAHSKLAALIAAGLADTPMDDPAIGDRQWYVDSFVVDCNPDALADVVARIVLAAGYAKTYPDPPSGDS